MPADLLRSGSARPFRPDHLRGPAQVVLRLPQMIRTAARRRMAVLRSVGRVTLVVAAMAAAPAAADPAIEQFYKGSQVRLLASAGPGSGYSIWTRFIGLHLGRHIPGEPSVI